MRILIAGASGLLGTTLAPFLAGIGHEIVRHGHSAHSSRSDVSCDLTNRHATAALLNKVNPEIVINLVAWSDVDKCEQDPHGAYLLNVRTVENLVASMRNRKSQFLIQISTDQVYDSIGPSREDDIRLTNTYALTKYAGELAASLMPSAILRTNFFGHSLLPTRKSFSDWALDNLRDGKSFTAFTDVMANPLSMMTLCTMIARVIEKRTEGVFNLGSRGVMSKADFVFEIARVYGLSTNAIKRGEAGDVNLFAYRPKDMSMDCKRFEAAFDATLPQIEDEIANLKRNADAHA